MKSKYHILPILLCLIAGFNTNAQTPGGVANVAPSFWLKADAGITQSGGAVSQWNDQSANLFHVIQATSARRPSIAVDTFNYYPVLYFDGNDSLRLAGVAYNAIVNVAQTGGSANKTSGSIFTVGRVPSPAAGGRFFTQWNSNAGDAFTVRSVVAAGGNITVGANSATVGMNTLPTVASNPPFILTGLDSMGSPANPSYHYYNGGMEQSTNAVAQQISTGTSALRVGLLLTGDVAEVITYKTQLVSADRKKVESYLAIKYGITLNAAGAGSPGTYYTSNGTALWSASADPAYHNNVIGIGRDDNTALYQKQSHQADDSTRIFINTLQTINAANTGTFSSDGQYLMMGNNAQSLTNIGSSEYPSGISARISREWKIINTAFNGTFSMCITSKSWFTVNSGDFVLLVDADGDFNSGAAKYTSADGLTFNYSGGVLTIGGITTAMIPTNSTAFVTLATATLPGGAASPSQTICSGCTPTSDLTLSSNGGTVIKWQYSNDNFSSDVHDISSSASSTLTMAQMGSITGTRYYRAVVENALYSTSNSSAVTINTSTTLPLHWLSIAANWITPGTKVSWMAGTEENVSHFEIYRSVDGINFVSVGKVNALNNNSASNNYSYSDYDAVTQIAAKLYYYVKSVDFDRKISNSKVVVLFKNTTVATIFVYPNPSKGEVHFNSLQDITSIIVYGANGSAVKQFNNINPTSLNYDLSNLSNGYYSIRLIKNNGEFISLPLNVVK